MGCEKTKEAILIDPGDEGDHVVDLLRKHGLTLRYILHTHAHIDHVGATHHVHEQFKSEVCLHPEDQILYDNIPMQAALFGLQAPPTVKIDQHLADKDQLKFGDHCLHVLHTPGHSPGSLSFHLKDNQKSYLLTGDTLFMGSVGRTDLWGGDYNTLMQSIKEKLWDFTEDTLVYPGHGPATNMGQEKKINPFLSGF